MAITLDECRRAVSSPDLEADVVIRLGELAKWIVRSSVLARVAGRRNMPELNQPGTISAQHMQPGGCLAVLVGKQRSSSILESAYLLPLHWREGGRHDERVPPMIRETADQVKEVLELSDFFLHLMLPSQQGPASRLFPDAADDCSSVFPALACALRMCVEGVAPDYRSMFTGKWTPRGMSRVSHLVEKTRAVVSFPRRGDPRIRDWFVPEDATSRLEVDGELERHRQANPRGEVPTVHFIPAGGDVQRVLDPLVARCGIRPRDDAELPVLQTYHQWLRERDPDQANSYYYDTLYYQISRRVLVDAGDLVPRPTHFVTVVSSPALVGLAHELFRFERILILFTVPHEDAQVGATANHRLDFSERADAALQLVEQSGSGTARLQPFVYRPDETGATLVGQVRDAIGPAITKFIGGTSVGEVMWDTTSGLRLFSHVLEKGFARDGDWMLNLHHQWSAQSDSRVPCTESTIVWRHVTNGFNPAFRPAE